MKKRSFSRAKNYRAKTKSFKKLIKFLKKYRHKKARQASNPENIYKKTGAWDII